MVREKGGRGGVVDGDTFSGHFGAKLLLHNLFLFLGQLNN